MSDVGRKMTYPVQDRDGYVHYEPAGVVVPASDVRVGDVLPWLNGGTAVTKNGVMPGGARMISFVTGSDQDGVLHVEADVTVLVERLDANRSDGDRAPRSPMERAS